ncbi:hypothetical protein CVT24_008905 [Panaeolus cyanescens]|uniref:Uncharacterized protein n=1 Tax=Panaeolus cyanescens TaxID=181874 RepID=A0A409WEK6_9AGAR|nr:hypothetical protein CVT24_008905 [Panaeolus cyanescens]
MSGPTEGIYRLTNYTNRWTVATKSHAGLAQPGQIVMTFRDGEKIFPEHSVFTVCTNASGQYSFQNPVTKMFIGCGEDEKGHPATAWTMTPQYWDVSPVGPGIWSISMADSYWDDCITDNKNAWAEILLREEKELVQYFWLFVAA